MSEYHERLHVFRGKIPTIHDLRINAGVELETQLKSIKLEIDSSDLVPGDIIEVKDN